jgi:hypothetical protein
MKPAPPVTKYLTNFSSLILWFSEYLYSVQKGLCPIENHWKTVMPVAGEYQEENADSSLTWVNANRR